MKKRSIFTLIELLVVIAIIAILASMLLPALNQARETARRGKCIGQLREISSAATMYSDDYLGYFPLSTYLADVGSYKPTYAGIMHITGHMTNPRIYICPSATSYELADNCLKALNYANPSKDLWPTGANTVYDWIHYAPNMHYVDFKNDGTKVPIKLSMTHRPSIKVMLTDSVNLNPDEYFSGVLKRGRGQYIFNTYSSSGGYTYMKPMMDPRHNGSSNIAWADGHVSTNKDAWRVIQGTAKKYHWDPVEKNPKN